MRENNNKSALQFLMRASAACAAVLVAACTPGQAPDGSTAPAMQKIDSSPAVVAPAVASSRRRTVPGEYLVKYRPGATAARVSKMLRDGEVRSVTKFRAIPGLQLVRAGGIDQAGEVAKALASDRDVEYVEPNFIVHALSIPNDPRFPNQWALNNIGQTGGTSPYHPDIGAEAAWEITTGSDDVVVGVVDSGVDYTHEDLAANIYRNEVDCDNDGVDDDANGFVDDCHGIDTVDHDSDPMDQAGHGTHVAGTIGAVGNNGIGIAGVAWHVKILPCRFLDVNGEGSTADAIACFDYLALMKDRGVNIIASNHSWGGTEYSRALGDAIAAHRARGMLVVAAAGNDGHDNDVQPSYPCNYPLSNVICVASTYEGRSRFSNVGGGTVHLGAPGEFIVSTTPHDNYESMDGTSMATPHVTGALVLLKAQDPTRDWRALRNLVIAGTVAPLEYGFPSIGNGRLNLVKSLTCANSVVLSRLQPAVFETLNRAPGDAVVIRALHINCAIPNGNVAVSVSSGETVVLHDDGVDPDDLAGDGEYAGRWVAPAAGVYDFSFPAPETDQFRVVVDAMLEPGFPVRKSTVTEFDDPPGSVPGVLAVGNIDSDPDLEIIADTLQYGPIDVLKHDGSEVPGWPMYQGFLSRGLSLGELDGDPSGFEIVANHYFSGTYAYDRHGSRIPGWPPKGIFGVDLPAPTIDLDGDGRDEVMLFPAIRPDGSHFSPTDNVPAMPPGGVVGMIAVGDLDADGLPDFVTLGGGLQPSALYVSDRDGLRPGFPVAIPKDLHAEGASELFIGDVDGDGAPDIVMTSFRRETTGEVHRQIAIFSNRGRLLHTIINDTGSIYAALADLDGDGIPEIIGSTEQLLHAWRADGTELPGWPVSILGGDFAGTTHPVVGDIDGDGRPDVIVGARFAGGKALHAIRHDGTSVAGFPKNFFGEGGGLNTPAIADIDLDGRNEIIVDATTGNGLRESVFVYDTHAAGPYGPLEWPQFMGGPQRRSYYETGKNLPNQAYLATQVYGAGKITADGGGIDCGSDCIERYAKQSTVVLRAAALTGGTFAKWRGACAGQGNPCSLVVNRFTETSADFTSVLKVNLSGSGSGTVTASLPGISCPDDCNEAYAARSTVTLTAAASAGNLFVGWGGACSGSQATCEVLIDDAKSVTATFTNRVILAVTQMGSGTAHYTTNPAGIDCDGGCSGEFSVGSAVDLAVVPASDSYVVAIIYPGCFQNTQSCRVTMNGPQNVQVQVERLARIDLAQTGAGTVSSSPAGLQCSASCAAFVNRGALSFSAAPALGWRFDHWGGDCAISVSPVCTVNVSGDLAISVVFVRLPYLAVDFQGTGSGSVQGTGAAIQCSIDCESTVNPPQPITLTALPADNSTFAGWSGACTGSATTCDLNFTDTATVGVTFNLKPPASTPPQGGGSGGGGGGRIDLVLLVGLASILATMRARRVSRTACRSNPGASRTRWALSRPCGSSPPAGSRTCRVDRAPARC